MALDSDSNTADLHVVTGCWRAFSSPGAIRQRRPDSATGWLRGATALACITPPSWLGTFARPPPRSCRAAPALASGEGLGFLKLFNGFFPATAGGELRCTVVQGDERCVVASDVEAVAYTRHAGFQFHQLFPEIHRVGPAFLVHGGF